MLLKCYTEFASKLGKLSSGQALEKVSIHYNYKEDQCQKMLNYCTVVLISHTSKVMHQILQTILHQ